MGLRRRAPAGVRPERSAYRWVGDHEAYRVRDLFRIDQPAQLGLGNDVLLDVILPQRADHRCIGEPGMDHTAPDSVKDRFRHYRGGVAFESRFGRGVTELALVSARGYRSDENDRSQ